ncbi:MAG: cytochrome c [Gemmatimonadota bacterium]|nr:cytochrome c [Gemmatimonadota bacterium]MDE3005548.1 cytochrome c [Gemmatimonadota bacterium]MDE3013875.1 cytochrome c [Gemmatimonadota bacterium]
MRVLIFILTMGMVGVTQAAAQATDPTLLPEGAQVYGDFCASCHNARASSERTDLEWVAIVLHMRARANFTKREAAAVLAFLQATNLPEAGVAMGAAGGVNPVNVVLPDSLRDQLIAVTDREEGTAVARRPGGRR